MPNSFIRIEEHEQVDYSGEKSGITADVFGTGRIESVLIVCYNFMKPFICMDFA